MRNLVTIFSLMLAFALTSVAQTARSSQGQHEFFVGASALQENVDRAYNEGSLLVFDDSRKSVGFAVGYDVYVGGNEVKGRAGTVGFGTEFDATFNKDGVALVTGVGNVTLKARNSKYVQPFVKAGAGFARADFGGVSFVNGHGIVGFETSEVFKAGGGVDWNTGAYSRTKIRTGVNYETTTFGGVRQHNARATVAVVF